MSRIQKMNKEYLPNLFKNLKWKQLDHSEKIQFGDAFVDMAKFDSEVNE
jgi:hypothetical protein